MASINHILRGHQIFGGKDLSAELPELGQSALYCVTEIHAEADIDRLTDGRGGGGAMTKLREVHTASWDEPLVMEMGRPGRRGMFFPPVEPGIAEAVGAAEDLIPAAMRRADPPALPELSEPEVQRHYLRLSQETQGMMHISLFGTCTMKYHPPVAEQAARRWLAELHPLQPEDTLQGVLAAVHGFDLILRELSGMDQFMFQAGGGADAAYTHAVVTRAWLAGQRRARPARRDRHLHPGPPLQCRHRRRRRIQGGDPDAGGGRLPVRGRAEGRGLQPHRRA